jgi:hypothetical protein
MMDRIREIGRTDAPVAAARHVFTSQAMQQHPVCVQ